MTEGVDQTARDGLADLRSSISGIRRDMVRRDVYEAEQKGVIARVGETEKDIVSLESKIDKSDERRAADRRLIMTSLVLPIIVALIILYVNSQVGR